MNALAAGAIGSVVTLVVAFGVRLASIPREIRIHDRRASERDEDLARWIVDRDLALRRRLAKDRNELAARRALSSGDYAFQLGLTKETALHEWRDQESQAARDVDRFYENETWLHALWRRERRPKVSLMTPDHAQPLLDHWRLPVSADNVGAGHTAGPINDPTTRTLIEAVADAPSRVREYQ